MQPSVVQSLASRWGKPCPELNCTKGKRSRKQVLLLQDGGPPPASLGATLMVTAAMFPAMDPLLILHRTHRHYLQRSGKHTVLMSPDLSCTKWGRSSLQLLLAAPFQVPLSMWVTREKDGELPALLDQSHWWKYKKQWMQLERSTWRTKEENIQHFMSQPSPITMQYILSMAWLCPGFWGSKRTDDEPKACFCLGWMVSLTLLWDFSCFKKTTKPSNKQSLPQCCTAPILPLSTRENRLPMQSACPCHQRIVPSTPLSTWLILSSSSAHRLVCLHSYLQPLHLRDCCHRHVLIPFQAFFFFFHCACSSTNPFQGCRPMQVYCISQVSALSVFLV